MPWTGRSARRFTKAAKSPAAKKKWARVANGILKHGGSDAKAVRIANAAVKRGRKRKQ